MNYSVLLVYPKILLKWDKICLLHSYQDLVTQTRQNECNPIKVLAELKGQESTLSEFNLILLCKDARVSLILQQKKGGRGKQNTGHTYR